MCLICNTPGLAWEARLESLWAFVLRELVRRGGSKTKQMLSRLRGSLSGKGSTLGRPSSGRATQCAGERWANVGRGYDLLGRFFGRHFLAGRRRNAGGRINQAAVLDDLFKL
jgi:hypothetical protein